MRHIPACCVAAATIAAAACSDQLGPSRRLIPNLGATADSSADSTPGGKPGPVASVTVTPPSETVPVGDSAGFFATLQDAQGNFISDGHVKWSVADPSVARIEGEFGQSLILRALRPGATEITARSHGKRGSAQLVVAESLPPPPPDSVATVSVSPDTIVVAAGDTAGFFATLRDAQGNPLSGRAVFWSVSDSTVARIEVASGQSVGVRALRSGSSLVTATSEGKSGSGSLFVR